VVVAVVEQWKTDDLVQGVATANCRCSCSLLRAHCLAVLGYRRQGLALCPLWELVLVLSLPPIQKGAFWQDHCSAKPPLHELSAQSALEADPLHTFGGHLLLGGVFLPCSSVSFSFWSFNLSWAVWRLEACCNSSSSWNTLLRMYSASATTFLFCSCCNSSSSWITLLRRYSVSATAFLFFVPALVEVQPSHSAARFALE